MPDFCQDTPPIMAAGCQICREGSHTVLNGLLVSRWKVVGATGIEPVTPTMSRMLASRLTG